MTGRKLSSLVLAGCFLLASSGIASARDRDDRCEARIHKAERKLEQAERRHGEHSRQAEKQRHEVEEAREKCGHHDRDHDRH